MRTPLKRRQGVDGLQAFNRQTLPALGGLGGDADEQSQTLPAPGAGSRCGQAVAPLKMAGDGQAAGLP